MLVTENKAVADFIFQSSLQKDILVSDDSVEESKKIKEDPITESIKRYFKANKRLFIRNF
jgi:hypothetical protein